MQHTIIPKNEDIQIVNGPIHKELNTGVFSLENKDYSATQEHMMNPFLKNSNDILRRTNNCCILFQRQRISSKKNLSLQQNNSLLKCALSLKWYTVSKKITLLLIYSYSIILF